MIEFFFLKKKMVCFEDNFALSLALLFVQNNESAAMFVYKKKILWELNSFHMLKLSFIPSNLHSCWARDWKRSIVYFTVTGGNKAGVDLVLIQLVCSYAD